mmetsp:Transcript_406/g.1129  ORF Transcript_406/g.1129 Transcript_406/m.1129 type:complete len:312 (+) Transcript_406:46-981(+)
MATIRHNQTSIPLICSVVLAGACFVQPWTCPRHLLRNLRCHATSLSRSELSERCFLISTSCAVDRRNDALAALANLCSPQVCVFERDYENGARGCYTSHITILQEMLAKDLPWAVIFEDNLAILSHEGLRQALQSVDAWTRRTSGWSVLHLSLVHSAASLRLCSQETFTPEACVLRVERTAPDWYGPVRVDQAPGLGTTAYVISQDAVKCLLEADAKQGYVQPIDDLLTALFSRTYAVFPAPVHRSRAPSLINSDQELFRSIMYDPRVFQAVERLLVWTGFSSSQLVWLFLATMAAWTLGVTIPLGRALLG